VLSLVARKERCSSLSNVVSVPRCAVLRDQTEALADPAIGAVLIASSTDTHADLVEAAARAGKAIFCEKPLDLDRRRAAACAAVVEQCGVPLMVAFNRRFDPNFARLEGEIRAGRIGRPEILRITSYDPAPPTIAFVRRSGGMFRDMMIHDLDMACWLLGEEPIELFATASVMVDLAIGEAGDVDTAVVTLRMKSGALCQIANSRRAVYGYDQRIEVFGSKGGISAEMSSRARLFFPERRALSATSHYPFFCNVTRKRIAASSIISLPPSLAAPRRWSAPRRESARSR
jgi:myo-inositol 2-dehydrogenase / D-chiro-inositol 1-dehydrogenase